MYENYLTSYWEIICNKERKDSGYEAFELGTWDSSRYATDGTKVRIGRPIYKSPSLTLWLFEPTESWNLVNQNRTYYKKLRSKYHYYYLTDGYNVVPLERSRRKIWNTIQYFLKGDNWRKMVNQKTRVTFRYHHFNPKLEQTYDRFKFFGSKSQQPFGGFSQLTAHHDKYHFVRKLEQWLRLGWQEILKREGISCLFKDNTICVLNKQGYCSGEPLTIPNDERGLNVSITNSLQLRVINTKHLLLSDSNTNLFQVLYQNNMLDEFITKYPIYEYEYSLYQYTEVEALENINKKLLNDVKAFLKGHLGSEFYKKQLITSSLVITRQDSLAAGNCEMGTDDFIRQYKIPEKGIDARLLASHPEFDTMCEDRDFLRVLFYVLFSKAGNKTSIVF